MDRSFSSSPRALDTYTAAMRIGLISDTHQPSDRKTLWQEVHEAFAGVDLILHGGDIVHPMVLDWLQEIAPVLAARGNNDFGWHDPRLEDVQRLDVEGLRIVMLHNMEPEDRPIDYLRRAFLRGEHADVIVTGHTHFERLDYRDGVLQINSGSPTHPHQYSTRLGTVGLLEIAGGRIEASIRRLGHSEGRDNPGMEYRFAPETGVVRIG
jgi:putative phosphoesterase